MPSMTTVAQSMLKSSIDYLRLRYITMPDIGVGSKLKCSGHAVPLNAAGGKRN